MDNLSKLRDLAGLSQYELASAAKVVRWRIARAELGSAELSTEDRCRVLAVIAERLWKRHKEISAVLNSMKREGEFSLASVG